MNAQQLAILKEQYALIKASRAILLRYCASITPNHFYIKQTSFGRGSIHNLLAHIANTYQFWIGESLLKKNTVYISYTDKTSLAAINSAFEEVDAIMEVFFNYLKSDTPQTFICEIDHEQKEITILEAFTHVITHEFHHKGQLLSLSRQLGYFPVDTDVLR